MKFLSYLLISLFFCSIIILSENASNEPENNNIKNSIYNDENLLLTKLFKFFTSEATENKDLLSGPPQQVTLGFTTPWAKRGFEIAQNSSKLTYISPVWFRIVYDHDDIKLVGENDVDEKWVNNVYERAQQQKFQKVGQDTNAENPFQPSLEKVDDLLTEHAPMIVPRVQLDLPSFPQEKLVKFFTEIQGSSFAGAQKCAQLIQKLLEKYPKFSGIVLEYGYLSLDKKTPLRSFFHALFSQLHKSLKQMNKKFLVVVPAPHFMVSVFETQQEQLMHMYSDEEMKTKTKEWEAAVFKEMEKNYLFSRTTFMELQGIVDNFVMMNYDYSSELINADVENYKTGNFMASDKDRKTINWLLENSKFLAISPYKWIEKTIQYYKTEDKNDMKKLLIGINFYGKELITINNLTKKTTDLDSRAVTASDLKSAVLEASCIKRNFKPETICKPFKTEKKLAKFLSKYNPMTREQIFLFSYIFSDPNSNDMIKESHEIAFPSWKNVNEKLALIRSQGVGGASIWELGQGLDGIIDLF